MAQDALQMRYTVKCSECLIEADQTFEGFQRAGWVVIDKGNGNMEWYCAGCVFKMKHAARDAPKADTLEA